MVREHATYKEMGTNVALNSSPILEVIMPWNSAVIIWRQIVLRSMLNIKLYPDKSWISFLILSK